MSASDAEQLALDGLAPRPRRKRGPVRRTAASEHPIARVVLDVQAAHLGATFDYLVDDGQSEQARPGVLVRVRFGGRRVNGIIWDRADRSDTPTSSLRFLERVVSPHVLVPAALREDITLIADAYGGTRANILRLAVPPRVARVDREQGLSSAGARSSFPASSARSARSASPASDASSSAAASSLPSSLRPFGGADASLGNATPLDDTYPTSQRRRPQRHLDDGTDGIDGAGAIDNADNIDNAASADAAARRDALRERFDRLPACYADWHTLNDALQGSSFRAFVVDPLPGVGEWCTLMAWMAVTRLSAGGSAVIVLPTSREVDDLAATMQDAGLRLFAPTGAANGGYAGDVAILTAALPPAERYRAYLAVATGQVRCVIGTRAAMYAPVAAPALFAIFDDAAYQNADGMMPYANARGVLRLRAAAHNGVFVAMANARSPISQWETESNHTVRTPVSGFSTSIRPLPSVSKERTPWVRWLNREELARLADPTIGARVPHTAVSILSKALDGGPILLSIPQDGVSESLSCAACHRQARCPRCAGPLQRVADADARCLWCGKAVVDWSCPGCGGERMRVVRVGAAGTARELQGLFRNMPVVLSSPSQPRGIVESVAYAPMIVIATPGAEPRVRGRSPAGREYRAVAILDAWTSLYAPGVDARVDALAAWMRVVSMCAPRSRGGQALLIGQADPTVARSLMLWDGTALADHELRERGEVGLPPTVAAACVWGRRDAVTGVLSRLTTLSGEPTTVLGPVPIAAPRTVDARELEVTRDRVKAVIRAPQSRRAELATRLRTEVARHVASREPGELRFQLDPKDLI